MRTLLTEIFELSQKCREIFILANRVSIDYDGVANYAIWKDTVNSMTKIETFIIFQCQIGTWILTVQI